jgi:hypothetical protein
MAAKYCAAMRFPWSAVRRRFKAPGRRRTPPFARVNLPQLPRRKGNCRADPPP